MGIVWVATFYAMAAGIPVNVDDYDRPRFHSKRACYMYVIKNVSKIRQTLREHLPVDADEIEAHGECHPEGSQRASD